MGVNAGIVHATISIVGSEGGGCQISDLHGASQKQVNPVRARSDRPRLQGRLP